MITLKISEVTKKLAALKQIDLSKNDKLTYAIKKTMDSISAEIEAVNKLLKVSEIQKEFNDEVETVNIKYTSVDEAGNIMTGDNGNFTYKFTKENLLLRNSEVKAIEVEANKKIVEYEEKFNNSEISINTFQAENDGTGWERVKDLDMFIVEELKGFLFK